jgi:cytochrome b involved in lipid metabolism
MIKRADEWIASSKKSHKSIFFYQDKVLDLTNFMEIHPGGKKALTNYINKDITNIIFTVYPHKKETTQSTLMNYAIGKIPEEDMKQQAKSARPPTLTPVKEKKKVYFENERSFK